MSYGGYWDKLGERFETRWALHQLVLMTGPASDIESLEREPVGEDEKGVDLWVNRSSGKRECHQCKRARGSRASWSMRDLHREGVFRHLKFQLQRDPSRHHYRLISRIPAGDFESLLREARDSRDAGAFWKGQVQPHSRLRRAFADLCRYLELTADQEANCESALILLHGSSFVLFRDDEDNEASLVQRLAPSLEGEARTALALLEAWLRSQLRRKISLDAVSAHLAANGFRLLRGNTDRFFVAGAELARKRAQQGRSLEFEARLADLMRQAEEQAYGSIQVLDGQWRLLKKLGAGGVADVWLAETLDPRWAVAHGAELFAVKILSASKQHDHDLISKFVEGARRMRALAHPAVVRVLSAPLISDGRHYYVMEHFDAISLERWLAERRLPFARVGSVIDRDHKLFGEAIWRVVAAVARTLSDLHQSGFIHGDVKPSNILVDQAGEVKLCDFDLVACELPREPCGDPVGTIPFLAPEVWVDKPPTALSDQFSFAMTLVSILAGGSSMLRGVGVAPVENVESLGIPLGLKRSLGRALSLDPQLRYASIEDLLSNLGPETFLGSDRGVPGPIVAYPSGV